MQRALMQAAGEEVVVLDAAPAGAPAPAAAQLPQFAQSQEAGLLLTLLGAYLLFFGQVRGGGARAARARPGRGQGRGRRLHRPPACASR